MKRFLPSAMLVAVTLLVTALLCPATDAAAEGVPCGTEKGSETVEGTLLLKTERSNPTLEFGRNSEKKNLILSFEVSGCKLVSAEDIKAEVFASEGQEAFGEAVIKGEDSQLTVEIPVESSKFSVGKHTAAVTVGGASIAATTNKISYQRTAGIFWPTLVAVIGGFLGALIGVVTKLNTTETKVKDVKLVRWIAVPVAVFVPVAAVWITSYAKVELWQPTPEVIGLLLIATVTAASGAAGAALLGEVEKSGTDNDSGNPKTTEPKKSDEEVKPGGAPQTETVRP